MVYPRKSGDKQEEAGTIQSQLDAIRHHHNTNGKVIAEVYTDWGERILLIFFLGAPGRRTFHERHGGR